MTYFYLGEAVVPVDGEGDWVWCIFTRDRKQRRWKMWPAQIHRTPWGEALSL